MEQATLNEAEIRDSINNASEAERFGSDPKYEYPALDDVALAGLAGDFVNLVAPETEADPAALLAQFLAAAGNVLGRIPCRAPDGMEHHTGVYLLLVGNSAKSRKGSSWYQVNRVNELIDRDWTADRVQSGASSGEGLIWAVRDPIVRREVIRQDGRVVDYQNVEVDPGVSDKRLLLVESEFAAVLKVLKREGNILGTMLRQAWDTGNIRTLTKSSPAKATGAHVSLIGHITIEELLRHFDSTEAANGFGNRFLWLCVRRSKLLPRGGRIDDARLRWLADRVSSNLVSLRKASEFRFSEPAYVAWDRLYPELSAERPGLLGSLLARAEAQVTRLAFIYGALDGSPEVEVKHLTAATALWEYCERSAEYIFGGKLGDPIADAILGALRQRPGGMTRTEISALFKRNLPAEKIERALTSLFRAGLVEREPKGSYSPERWAVTKTTKSTKTTKGESSPFSSNS
jgi:hypothetical protein